MDRTRGHPFYRLRVRHWALLTAILYGAALCALTIPLILVAWGTHNTRVSWDDFARLYSSWEYWTLIGTLCVVIQLYLLLPIQVVQRRPVRRGRWIALAISGGLATTLLMAGLLCSLTAFFFGDKLPFEKLHAPTLEWIRDWMGTLLILAGLAIWIGWAMAFWRYLRNPVADEGLAKMVRLLIMGSVAELLVAVPCHVYVRSRDYCCAGAISFAGLAAGWAVLLFAFGPGVLFLFVARVRRLRLGARPARPIVPPRLRMPWGPRTHDAATWAVMALAVLASASARWSLQGEIPSSAEPLLVTIAFSTMAVAALRHARKAISRNEPGGLTTTLLALFLAEAMLIVILWNADGAVLATWRPGQSAR
jgi:hypothetical protein